MGTHDTPPDELPLSTLGGTAAGTGNGSTAAAQSHSNFKSASPKDPLLPEECARLKPANGDHIAYGAAPNAHPPPPQLDHSSPLIETPSNGSGPTSGAGGPTSRSTTTTAKRHSLLLSRGDTELSIDHSGLQRFLPKCMHSTFVDRDAEKLYQEYYSNEKRSDFRALLLIVTVVNLLLLLLQVLATVTSGAPPQLTDSHGMRHLAGMGVCLLVCCLLFGLAFRRSTAETDEAFESKLWTILPYGLWGVMTVQIVGDLWTFTGGHGPAEAGSSSLIWLLLYTYSIYVIFPLRFRLVCTLSLGMAGIQLVTVLAVAETRYKFARQILANLLLIGSVNLLSVMSFYFYERQQRRAFLETRQSLEAKILLEEESEEQERLLLSVLPKHVAAEIRQDLGAVVEGQFHKIYMSRHENVSILFADIVGFTAFSSTVTAPELVKTLNELFARFDKLSEKYHQLRIKILGDCYYCISGAPQERPDHAVLCVHMGLSMVEAIKSVREQTKSGVDMRVGVHTGGILAGVLGQRQWQFDVYSRDVEFANKMESGGLPGRVHISERTLSFLNGEFEVIDGEGATREEAIRLAGVKTYFIVKVLKPYPEGTLDANLIDAANGANGTGQSGQEDNETTKLNAPRDSSPLVHLSTEDRDTTLYSSRLHGELIHRDSHQMFGSSIHPLRLTFKDATLEADYRDCRDTTSVVSLLALPLTLTVVLLVYFLVAPIRLHTALTLLVCALILLFIAFICTVPMVVSSIPKPFALLCNSVQAKSWLRLTIVIIMLAFWVAALVVLNIFYAQPLGPTPLNNPPPHPPSAQPPLPIDPGTRLSTSYRPPAHPETPALALPQYLLFFSLLCLLAITALTRISYLAKIALISSLVIGQAVLLYTHLSRPFALYVDLLGLVSNLDIRHYYLLILATLLLALVIINRQFELMTRRLFLWQRDVDQQKSKVSDMRRKNEKLVYNILPPNVAIHFLGKRKSDEELYSKSYECVGVLFASMPNFSDFYTEESVNNQGLECIRFLNEVISDYDQLLSQPRFKDISKIKTISSTYMAATGLTEEVATVAEAATEITTRWAHLAQLTEFALTLKETLNFINKESFNNFVLRMGINQGPITAGVIGARKPHYDIWGNTVNVASRMESTGKAGCIQVVEETSKILEHFGYIFEQRGLVSVKGKGKLMTYYLVGKKPSSPK